MSDILLLVFAVYPAACIAFVFLDANPIRMNWLYILQATLLLVFIAAVLVTLWQIRDRKKKTIVFALVTVIFFTIAPMMVVSQYGYRTYYTTFIAVLILALYLVREFMPEKLRCFLSSDSAVRRTLLMSCVTVFLFASTFLFMQTIYNSAFYVVRADDIISQAATEDVIEVPVLPCRITGMEEVYYTSISASIGCPSDKVKLIDIYTGANSEAYVNVIQSSPVSAIQIVMENLEYRDPGFFDKTLGFYGIHD